MYTEITRRVANRVELEALYLIEHQVPIRDVGLHFGVSKSTIQLDLAIKLPEVRPDLVSRVNEILERNTIDGRLKGGLTRQAQLRGEHFCEAGYFGRAEDGRQVDGSEATERAI